ncbi:hypothetical protein J6590_063741 [Homalodisca vitripennis]|nr:hypothetical protein J6590_063741 [Homalodisca vitripennis]
MRITEFALNDSLSFSVHLLAYNLDLYQRRRGIMPRKKSNLNNPCSRKVRLQRARRARESEEETAARNAAQRIRTAKIRSQESQEQRNKRLRQNVLRARTARQQNIARFRELERTRQQTNRVLTRASFFRLAFEYEPDINYLAHSKITIGAMDKICQYCHAKNCTATSSYSTRTFEITSCWRIRRFEIIFM